MEDNVNFNINGRQPQFFGQWKTTSMSYQLEDPLSLLLGNAALASPSFSSVWHSSAPACLLNFLKLLEKILLSTCN